MDLKQCRERLGWSVKKTCAYLGVSFNTYRKYEQEIENKSPKGQEYLSLLAQALANAQALPPTIDSSTDDFAALRKKNAYFVDKSPIIKDILTINESMILFARPRRFGKSLTLSMIRYFFDETADPALFDGLLIAEEKALCDRHQNAYPVIALTFKDVEGKSFDSFLYQMSNAIAMGLLPFRDLSSDPRLSAKEQALFERLLQRECSVDELRNAMLIACEFIARCRDKKPIILIDEYDVPLQKASTQGDFYDEALDFVSTLLSSSLKSNPNLERGIVTGCLTIGKESVFTGLNNVLPYTVLDAPYATSFGFNKDEVGKLLSTFSLSDKFAEMQRYYDGYAGGLFCPFDVMRYVGEHIVAKDAAPKYYWSNTSENEIIRRLLDIADRNTKVEIERLIRGESLRKRIDRKLTYRNLYDDADNLYSVLLFSGYLTAKEQGQGQYALSIPNQEIRHIFQDEILKWLESSSSARAKIVPLSDLLFQGQLKEASAEVSAFLFDIIHLHDASRDHTSVEAFYHGILLPWLKFSNASYMVASNPESGEGYVDIAITDIKNKRGLLLECKYRNDGDLHSGVEEALAQAKKKRYDDYFPTAFAIRTVGVAFCRKECLFGEEGKPDARGLTR